MVSDLEKADFPTNNLVPLIETVHDRSVVETFRGCTRGCRFCQALYLVPSELGTPNVYDVYYTTEVGRETYSWIKLCTTEINLSNYATKDELTQLEAQVSDMAIPGNVRQAIASVLENVAFANDDGYSSELAIIRAWADNLVLVSIDAVFTQGGNNIYATDSLDKLKQYLVVTANYDDSSSAVLGDNDYTLSGTLTVGTSTITVTYQGKTDTFTVTVSASPFLYVLPSTFTSDGDSVVDTGFMPEKNKTYTILCESTESTASSAAVFIYGNRLTHGATSYLGLTSQTSKVWGMGITYSSRISAAQSLLRTAVVMVVDGDGKPSCSISYKIGSNAIASKNNSYNFDTTDSSIVANMMLGDCTNHGDDGFLGSVTYFAIYDGEMAAADITDFLTNGAS